MEYKTLRPQSEEQPGSTSAGLKSAVKHHRQTPPIESAAKESASVEETPIGGASREPLSPGHLREPRLREAAVRTALGSGHTGEREFILFVCFRRK